MQLFNIGFSELIVVLLIAFLVVGPKDLPKVARWLGRMVKKLRLMIRELKAETGWDEFEKEYKSAKNDVDSTIKDVQKDLDIRPDLKSASKEVESSIKGVENELKKGEQVLKNATKKK